MRFALAVLALLYASQVGARLRQEPPPPAPIRFARHPSLSPDGKRIAFSYKGDIWIAPSEGGAAQRLTVHEAHDQLPCWSPDGKWIAFSSRRAGNYDIWVASADGGAPRQLTFHSADDSLTDWKPDGRELLFTSARETTRTSALYAIDIATGRSRLIREDDAALANGRYTVDGSRILCTRGGSWIRKGYRGSGRSSLLVLPSEGGAGAWLVRDDANARWAMPAPDGKSFVYVTDRSGAPNLVRRGLGGKSEARLTRFVDGTLMYPSMSRDGSRIAFERNFGLWTLDTATGRAREIKVTAPTEDRQNPVRRVTYTGGVQDFALSPDGRRLAFVVHGEVFVQPTSGVGEAERLTDTPQREEDICWSPDGKQIALISDQSGSAELYVLDVATKKMRQLSRTPDAAESAPSYAPDGKSIAYLRGGEGRELCVVGAEGGTERLLARDPTMGAPKWSPDGKWIAYERMKSHSAGTVADVFLVPVADPKPVNITRYPVVNARPVWTSDGRRIVFASNRNTITHLYSVALRDTQPDAGAGTAGDEAPGAGADAPFDLAGIHLRARRITSGDNPIGAFAVPPDGRSIVFAVGQLDRTDLWRVAIDGGAPTRLTTSGEAATRLQFAPDGSRLYYTVGGSLRSLMLAGPAPAPTPVAINARMEIDNRAELTQIFDEAWRKMRDGFYDPKMHGCDWNGVRERYRPALADIATREDFGVLFGLALGELNASHVGLTAPPTSETGPATASVGVALDDAYAGPGVKVRTVMPSGPADRARSKLQAGDVILRVADEEVTSNERYYELLGDRAGKQTELSVQTGSAKPRTVSMRPITGAAYKQLEYDRWVKERETIVDKLSGGRLVYVHLSGMGADNLEKFRRAALGDATDKDGMVLDVRFNGGGSIADEMFQIIESRVFGWRTIRGDPNFSPAPLPCFAKPLIVLANESSLSNAEVFPWGVKALKVGKVVGMRTYGGVIGTGGTTLIDGSSLRMPAVGSFTLDGRNMENNGCPPDIEIEHTPDDIVAGHDRQLERAVSELLRQVGKPKKPKL